jgi:signal transduction histidine kinase/streptogramin lyase
MTRWLSVFLLLSTVSGWGQPVATNQPATAEPFAFDHYGQAEGLSQGTGYAVAQFDDFMWIGTQDGLNQFDGYGFRVFRAGGKRTLSNSFVQTLLADSQGQFWVGTGAGLNLYRKDTQQFDTFGDWLGHRPGSASGNRLRNRHQLDTVSIKKLLEDRQHNHWVLTDGAGLFRVSSGNKTGQQPPQIATYFTDNASNKTLFSGCIAPDGELWISTYNAVYQYDAHTDQFRAVLTRQQLDTASPIGAIVFDKAGNLWVGTRTDGVFLVTNPTKNPRIRHYRQADNELSSNDITELICDRVGRIWIGSRTGGIMVFDPARRTFSYQQHTRNDPRSLAENSVWSLFEDRQGLVWAGFSSRGVAKYDPRQSPFRLIQHDPYNPAYSLPDAMVFKLTGQGDAVYIGTSTGGLARYSTTTHRITSLLPGQVGNEVRVITPGSGQTLWLADWQALYHYDPARETVRRYPTNRVQQGQLYVYAAHALTNETGQTTEIWTGGNNGLHRFDVPTSRWIPWATRPVLLPIADYTIRLLYAGAGGVLWIGTLGHGLFRYDGRAQTLRAFGNSTGLLCANIRSVLEVGQTLWVGTDCGLYQLNLTTMRVTRHYTAADGLPNEVIYGILPDNEGYLWLSSNQGLTRFSTLGKAIKSYDATDGLQSNEFNTNVTYKHPDGTLFFGGVNGVTYFKTNALQPNPLVPPVRITGISVLDSAYNPNQKQLTLGPDENFIEFSFTALNFSNTRKNQYQYQLTNVDPGWVNARYRRTANYTNLPPGRYTFRVKGSNDDGVWNEPGASVNIVINPPFYQTWTFRIIALVLLSAGFYALYRNRIYRLKQQQEQEFRVSVQTQELERQRFAKELHDGVGANLAVLKLYLTSLGSPTVSVDELKQRAIAVLETSVSDIRSIIHDMHPRSLTEQGLAQTIADMVGLLNESHQLTITFERGTMPKKLPEAVEINLFRVVQELLQNTLKHAHASHVWLGLRHEADALHLTYRDDGYGLDTALLNQPTGNGLVNIQQRVALLKGTSRFESKPGQGTTVTIAVPVG